MARRNSYDDYVRGLRMVGLYHGYGAAHPVRSLDDYLLAQEVVESLESAVIGAGRNTYKNTKERAARARQFFERIPRPHCYLGHKGCNGHV